MIETKLILLMAICDPGIDRMRKFVAAKRPAGIERLLRISPQTDSGSIKTKAALTTGRPISVPELLFHVSEDCTWVLTLLSDQRWMILRDGEFRYGRTT